MNENTRNPDDEDAAPAAPPAADEPVATDATEAGEEAAAAEAPDHDALAGMHTGDRRESPPAAPARRGVTGAVALLALLLALVALAAAGYLWWASQDRGAAVAGHTAEIERLSGTLEEARSSLRDLQARVGELGTADTERSRGLRGLEERLEGLEDRLASVPGRLSSLESSMASLQGISAGARDAWLLAEAEYYLQLANAELQLAGNPERALLALEFADQRIRQLADPALAEVRRTLTRELRAVEAMEKPDLQGISMTLASLAETVDSLPLASETAEPGDGGGPPPEALSGIDRALASVKAAFSDIVTVRRTDEAVTPLISPEAAWFLRANLALRLQTARLALLRGEQEIFEQSLADAAAWLRDYYDTDSQAVRSAVETLSGLRAAEFTVTPPDISGSLRLLREFRQRNAAGTPAAPTNEPAQ